LEVGVDATEGPRTGKKGHLVKVGRFWKKKSPCL